MPENQDISQTLCRHRWQMVDTADGMVVMKKCFHCAKVSTCFCFHRQPPLETCREDPHFWNFLEASPAFHFDLACTKCNLWVRLDELVALMVCTGCDPECPVDHERRKLAPGTGQVCIALGRRPIDERKQLPDAKIAVLGEFLRQQSHRLQSAIKLAYHDMVANIEKCDARILSRPEQLFAACSH